MTHWLFMIPLSAGLASGFYVLRSSDELNNSLIGTFTLICLLISLFLAPWELQLLIAILVMVAARYFWLQINNADDTLTDANLEESSEVGTPVMGTGEDKGTTRNYRGVAYGAESTAPSPTNLIPKADSSTPRTYRGVAYDNVEELVYALDKLANPSKKPRKYRGASVPSPSQDTTSSSD